MKILTANHWIKIKIKIRDHYGRVRRRTEGAKGNYNSIGRTTVSINSDTSEIPEIKPKTKYHTWAGLWPRAHV